MKRYTWNSFAYMVKFQSIMSGWPEKEEEKWNVVVIKILKDITRVGNVFFLRKKLAKNVKKGYN